MKNFLRALRYSLPYRVRIGISIACAVCGPETAGVAGRVLPVAEVPESEGEVMFAAEQRSCSSCNEVMISLVGNESLPCDGVKRSPPKDPRSVSR